MAWEHFKRAINDIVNEYNLDILLLLVIILFGIYRFFLVPIIYVSTTDAVIDGRLINVTSRVGGQIVQCYIDKNQEVKKGDLLVEIDPTEYRTELIKVETNIEINRAKLKILSGDIQTSDETSQLASPAPKYKSVAKDITKYAKTYEPEDVAENNLTRKKMVMGDAITNMSEDVEKSVEDINIPKPVIDRSSITVAENETPEALNKEIKSLESRKEELKLMLYSTKIYAPRDGVISGISVAFGDAVNPSDVICSIIPKQVWVIARVNPEKLPKIKIGQGANIKIVGYRNRKFKGVVTSVDKTAKVYKVKAQNQIVEYDANGDKITKNIPAYQIKIEFIEDYSDFNLAPDTEVYARIKVGLD